MKRYEAILSILILIMLGVCIVKLSDTRTRLALEKASKCKIVLDYDCIEYGKCKCKK